MAEEINAIIADINNLDEPSSRRLPLPDDALIERYEEIVGIKFSDDYIVLLKNVSNAFVGRISLLTLNNEMGDIYGELYSAVKQARDAGVPVSWLPICEDNGDYYCIVPDGKVCFWDHNGATNELWPDLATWAREVWLSGK